MGSTSWRKLRRNGGRALSTVGKQLLDVAGSVPSKAKGSRVPAWLGLDLQTAMGHARRRATTISSATDSQQSMPPNPNLDWRAALIPGPSDPTEWANLAEEVAATVEPLEAAMIAERLKNKLAEEPFASNPAAWKLYGDLSYDADPDAYVSAYRRVAELSCDAVDWIWAGHAAFWKRPDEARSAYLEAVRLSPNTVRPWAALLDLAASEFGDLNEARNDVDGAVRSVIDRVALWNELAYMRRLFERSPPMLDYIFSKFSSEQVNDGEPWWTFAEAFLGEGRHEAACSAAREAIRLAPDTSWYRAQLAQWLSQSDASIEAALLLDESVARSPSDPILWSAIARLTRKQSNAAEVDALLERFRAAPLDKHPSSSERAVAWGDMGAACEVVGRFAEAEECYDSALATDPGSARVLRANEALQLAQRAVEEAPDEGSGHAMLGYVLGFGLHRWDEAVAAYRAAVARSDDNRNAWTHLAAILSWHRRLTADEELANREEAAQAFTKALSLGMRGSWAWVNYGVFLRERAGDHVGAEAAFLRALEEDPKEHGAWLGLAKLFHLDYRRYDEARDYYEKARSSGSKEKAVEFGLSRLRADITLQRIVDEENDRRRERLKPEGDQG